MVSYREGARSEELNGLLWKKNLNPGLRSDITHFALVPTAHTSSPQDDFAITVLKREPLEVEFQITANEATDAAFTPDSQNVVFGTEGLRFEKWVSRRATCEVRELVVRRDCWNTVFT